MDVSSASIIPEVIIKPKVAKTKQTRADFTKLSDEIVLRFLSYLKDPRDLAMASSVCESWQKCAQDDKLWDSMGSLFGIEGELDFWKIFVKLPNYTIV